jgi:peptide deformylase
MKAAMLEEKGVGISAVQVGITARLYLVRGKLEEDTAGVHAVVGHPQGLDFIAFVDPEIPEPDGPSEIVQEGCLSFPGISLYVERFSKVSLRTYTYPEHMDAPITVKAEGLYAQAIQHEDDHLYGVLMVDFVSRLKAEAVKKKMLKLAKSKAVKAYAGKRR